MKPTMSANRTVTTRRSATGAGRLVRAIGPPVAPPGPAPGTTAATGSDPPSTDSREPQSPQNRALGLFAAPHDAQIAVSREPHSPQNLRPASLSVPHAGQFTAGA